MATLGDIIRDSGVRRRKPGGQLVESTGAELQTLAGIAGLPSTPLTAVGAGLIGATPHQTKMVGTPNQKQASLQISVGEQDRLSDVVRRQGVRTEATEEEKARIERAKQLGSISDIGTRVQNLVDSYIPTATPTTTPQLQVSQELAAVPAEAQATVRDSLQKYIGVLAGRQWAQLTPAEQQTALSHLQAASTASGLGRAIAPEEVPSLLQSMESTVGKAVAQAIPGAESVTVGNLISSGQLQYSSTELAGLLGIDEATTNSLSLDQLAQRIADVEARDTARLDQLRAMVSDPSTGQAERMAARQELLEMSGVGTAGIDTQLQSVIEAVEAGDRVQFAGREFTLEQLLNDSEIEKVVSNYLSMPETDPAKQELRKSEPEFTQYIDAHAEAFKQAVDEAGKGVSEYSDVQKWNQEQLSTLSGLKLDPKLQALVLPGFDASSAGQLSDRRIDLAKDAKPIYRLLREEQGALLLQNLNELSKSEKYADLLPQLVDMDETELRKLGIYDNSQKWRDYLRWRDEKDRISSLTDTSEILTEFFDEPVDYQDLVDKFHLEKQYSMLGLDNNYSGLQQLLDRNRDGKVDPASALRDALVSSMGDITLRDLISGKGSPAAVAREGRPRFTEDQRGDAAYRLLTPFLDSKGKVSGLEKAGSNWAGYTDDDLTNVSLPEKYSSVDAKIDSILLPRRREMIRSATGLDLSPEWLQSRIPGIGNRVGGVLINANRELAEAEKALTSIATYLDTLPPGSDLRRLTKVYYDDVRAWRDAALRTQQQLATDSITEARRQEEELRSGSALETREVIDQEALERQRTELAANPNLIQAGKLNPIPMKKVTKTKKEWDDEERASREAADVETVDTGGLGGPEFGGATTYSGGSTTQTGSSNTAKSTADEALESLSEILRKGKPNPVHAATQKKFGKWLGRR